MENFLFKNLSDFEKDLSSLITNIKNYPSQTLNDLNKLKDQINTFMQNNLLEKDKKNYKKFLSLILNIDYQIIVSLIYLSKFDEALDKINQVKNFYTTKNLKKDLIFYKTLLSEGIILSQLGNLSYGIKIFKKILLKSLKNKNLYELKGILYNNLAESFNSLKLYKKSLLYYKKAYFEFKKLRNKQRLIISINNITDIYLKTKKINLAKIFALKLLKFAKEFNDFKNISTGLCKLANVYLLKGNPLKSYKLNNKSIKISKKYNFIDSLILNYILKIKIYLSLNKEFFKDQKENKIINLIKKTYKYIIRNKYIRFLNDFFDTSIFVLEKMKKYKLLNYFLIKYLKNLNYLNYSSLEFNKKRDQTIKSLLDLKDKEYYYYKYLKIKSLNDKLKKIHNLQKKDISFARKIYQNLILSEIPFIPGLHIFFNYREGKNLSGDFFNIKILSPEIISIFIADVCGHGIYSSFSTIILKLFFNMQIEKKILLSPSLLMSNLNTFIINNIKLDNYITGFYCVIDLNKKEIDYCSAGHNPLLFLKDDISYNINANSLFLGIKEDTKFIENKIHFNENSFLLIFTDGLSEFKIDKKSLFDLDQIKKYFFGEEKINKIDINDLKIKIDKIFDYLNNFYRNNKNFKKLEIDDATILLVAFQ